MRDVVVPVFGLILLVAGAMLLLDGYTAADLNQTVRLFGGAILLSLGISVSWLGVRNWWKWRIVEKEYRNEQR